MCDSAGIASSPFRPHPRQRLWQLAGIAAAVTAVASLRLVFGASNLQGLLFVVITAVVAWRIGTRAGLASAVMGLIASHAVRVVANPAPGSNGALALLSPLGLPGNRADALLMIEQHPAAK